MLSAERTGTLNIALLGAETLGGQPPMVSREILAQFQSKPGLRGELAALGTGSPIGEGGCRLLNGISIALVILAAAYFGGRVLFSSPVQ